MTSRRAAIKQALGTAAAFAVPDLWRNERLHLEVARQAATWIRHARQDTPHGVAWPVDPLVPSIIDTESLYSGTPGSCCFCWSSTARPARRGRCAMPWRARIT